MMGPWYSQVFLYWMMSKVSKGKVLTVEVSWRSLIHGIVARSLSSVYTCTMGSVSGFLMLLVASLRLSWHWRHMLNEVAGVSCVEIPRPVVMEGGTYGYTGMWTWLKRPYRRKSCEVMGPPV